MKATLRRVLFGGVPLPSVAELGVTALRIFAGLSLAFAHGLGKVMDPSDIIGAAGNLGFPMPTAFGWAAALSEFVGGICLALGLFTRWAALFILGVMCTAAFLQHMYTNQDPYGRYEMALLFLMISVQFLVIGGGRLSADRLIRTKV